MCDTVFNVLTDEFQTVEEIYKKVIEVTNDPEISRQMVVSRLTKLTKSLSIHKHYTSYTPEGGKTRNISTYKLAGEGSIED
ncbi:MAG: hypothetical protein NC548_22770 [Lachnospiraceae bacterium]|nr:hypothetical protein [Lachnospiraceae bacterium]